MSEYACRWRVTALQDGFRRTLRRTGDGVVAGLGGALERAVMEALWSSPGPLRVRELLVRLNDGAERPLAYNTVQTVTERLARKGLLVRTPEGQAFRYAPTQTREEFTVAVMLDALTDTTDHGAILARFAQSVDPTDAQELLAALRRREDDESEG